MGRYLAPAALGAFAAGAVKDFAAIERQMARIGITADASAAETEAAFRRMQDVSKEMALPVDAAVSALDTLVSSGLSLKEAMDFLPSVLATAQASGSATEDIANTAIKASSALKIQAGEMQHAFDIMVMGGKAGQFELKDMAAFIPELANSFASLGYTGEGGLKQLIAVLQTLREDTGSASAAATQAQNIFGKMFSEQTAKKFADFGINLRKEMEAAKASGEDAISAFVRLSKEALKGDLSKLPLLFTDQEFRLGMQSLITSPEALEKFVRVLNTAQVDGTVFRDLQKVTSDTQASIDRMAASWEKMKTSLGGKVAGGVVPVLDAINDATDKSAAVDRALKNRGMGYLESQWHRLTLSQEEHDRLAIEGGFKDPALRAQYEQGPKLPDGWKADKEFPGGGTSNGAMPEAGPIPSPRPAQDVADLGPTLPDGGTPAKGAPGGGAAKAAMSQAGSMPVPRPAPDVSGLGAKLPDGGGETSKAAMSETGPLPARRLTQDLSDLGPKQPEGWKSEKEFPGGGASKGAMPEAGPIPTPRPAHGLSDLGPKPPGGPEKELPSEAPKRRAAPDLSDLGKSTGTVAVPVSRPTYIEADAGRDQMTAVMLARRAEIDYLNKSGLDWNHPSAPDDFSGPAVGYQPWEPKKVYSDSVVDKQYPRLDKSPVEAMRDGDRRSYVERHAGMEPWTPTRAWEGIKDFFSPEEAQPVGEALAQAAIARMSSDAGAVGTEMAGVVRDILASIAPQIGAAIGQAFAASASQVKVGVNVPGAASANPAKSNPVKANTGRSMPELSGANGGSAF
nr:phage tail tape measure protein [Mycoplana azooxidifex]